MQHVDRATLEAGLAHVRGAPKDEGTLELIVRRPAEEERETVDEAVLDVHEGLVGDNWLARGSRATEDGTAHPDAQITLMGSRAADLVAQGRKRWPLAGDQLYVDLDVSDANLPPGTRLAVGSAVLEVTALPHTGCGKFTRRFGIYASKVVNSPTGRELSLRGRNARVVNGGTIRTGDAIRRL